MGFCQVWDWWWNINNKISFHFRLFPRKINDRFFKESKKTILEANLGPFCPNLGPKFGQKWIFLEKRTLSVFEYSNHLALCKKLEKINDPFLRKILSWGQTDRKQWLYRTLHRTGVQKNKILKVKNRFFKFAKDYEKFKEKK